MMAFSSEHNLSPRQSFERGHDSISSFLLNWSNLKSTPNSATAKPDDLGFEVENIVSKTMEDFEESLPQLIRVQGSDGKVFDKRAFLDQYSMRLKRTRKLYSSEIARVQTMEEELAKMIENMTKTTTGLRSRVEDLKFKKFQNEDINFIKPVRMKELERIKDLQLRPGEINMPLNRQSFSHKQDFTSSLLMMQVSLHAADQFDPEVVYLREQANNSLRLLGVRNDL